jgi:hypothetical protein
MGFGSYDEAEQQKQARTEHEDDDVEVDEQDRGHDGESTFQMDGSTDDMLAQLKTIKADAKAAEDADGSS